MAKSWKSFVQRPADSTVTNALLTEREDYLNQSLQELAKTNEGLQEILVQRQELEARLNSLLNPARVNEDMKDPRYANEIIRIDQKQKEDKKRIDVRKKLEARIAQKNNEFAQWVKRRDQAKKKISKAKELLERSRQQHDRKIKKPGKTYEGFDYENISRDKRKDVDQEKDIFIRKPRKKPIATKAHKENDRWVEMRDKDREVQSLRNKHAKASERKENQEGLTGRIERIEKQKNRRVSAKLQEKDSEERYLAEREENRKQNLLETIRVEKGKQNREDERLEKNEAMKLERIKERRAQRKLEARMATRKLEEKRDARREERKEARKNEKNDKYSE